MLKIVSLIINTMMHSLEPFLKGLGVLHDYFTFSRMKVNKKLFNYLFNQKLRFLIKNRICKSI